MAITRYADVDLAGDLRQRQPGTINYVSSGAFSRLPVTWASRTEEHNGRTSPEELIAAAHASCFSMAFSAGLAKNGTPPTSLDVRADDHVRQGRRGLEDRAQRHHGPRRRCRASTPAKFAELAEDAKDGCPVSAALKGNVELAVDAAARLAAGRRLALIRPRCTPSEPGRFSADSLGQRANRRIPSARR